MKLASLFLLACAGPALAQAPAYDSAFSTYRAYREPVQKSWKESNAQLSGAGHGMHQGAPEAPAAPAAHDAAKVPAPAPTPKAADHQHHPEHQHYP